MAQILLDFPSTDVPSIEDQVNQIFTARDFRQYDDAVDDLLTLALGSVSTAWHSVEDSSAERIRDELLLAVPETVRAFGPQISDVAAIEYQDLRSAAGIRSRHRALLAPPPPPSRTESLVRWSVGALFTPTSDRQQMWTNLAGGLIRILLDQQRQTMIDNAVDDIIDGPIGTQRLPRPGCCAFCAMLASRSAAFGVPDGQRTVIGRGVPLEAARPGAPGRRPGGVRPRGTQQIGQLYHDYCRCREVPVWRSTAVGLERDAEGYLEEYLEARRALSERKVLDYTQVKAEDGSLRRHYFWRDRETGERLDGNQASQILQWMRYQTGRK
ncbi:hypothetical protein [Nesterenkonia rhizosphaerae]|uniref:Capsid maturation protease n=1 Tax=Nesterenkonia rhizosphaerae TaxID=1348272 RepID=A0ABP9G015_9MICC